jgi:hypothetical protein
MLTAGFLRQQWPKWHEHLVEECDMLHVNDVLRRVQPTLLATRWEWTVPGPLTVRLVARQGGPFKRWWIECPGCGGRRDALYLPPNATRWACRECHDLIYATQRHGFRHPLRKVLTHRKRATLRREVMRQERRWARGPAKQARAPLMSAEAVADLERAIDNVRAFGEALKRQREEKARQHEAATKEMQARFAALGERALGRLRQLAENAPAKHVRERARRRLERYTPHTAAPDSAPRTVRRGVDDVAIEFTPDAVAYLARTLQRPGAQQESRR